MLDEHGQWDLKFEVKGTSSFWNEVKVTHKITQAQNTPETANHSHQNVWVCVVLLRSDWYEKLPNDDHHVAKP
jgi:hypothetical protein